MNRLLIELKSGKTRFVPGETLQGTVAWSLSQSAQAIEVRLFWFTQGQSAPEATVIATRRIEQPALKGREEFEFEAPAFPFSFRGTLFELIWGLELVSLPAQEVSRQVIVIAPEAQAIVLPGAPGTPPPLPRAA
jgi:hypothetical protein